MESETPPAKLTYFLAEKNSIVIVTMIGLLNRESVASLGQCQEEVLKSKAKWVILNLRDLGTVVEKPAVQAFARFQKAVRDMPAVLRVSSVHPNLRKLLDAQGVLRAEEITNNLAETLKTLPLKK